jgi:tetratricopeptide (TPR) repeat protein
MNSKAKVWQETVTIPTYGVGKPDKNPMFLENRVYQGSSGKVYPYPVIDKIYDEKKDKDYIALYLENEYLKVQILPELGGRIQQAVDKTNGYNFVYHNEVIKPALVGLLGPWISGGIEFNWPQHHRPTTFMKVDYTTKTTSEGAASVLIYDYDRINGTSVVTAFTLYPDKAYIEIHAELYNPTCEPQTFLWWANPAVAVNNDTQSIFPPDVHAVFDHGKRDVSRFPIATGIYYKHDYGSGVDISRYRNIPVPTSYMAYKSDYDFVGNYDYSLQAGLLHVADHHIAPGKKQWTWGCGDFGKAWDRNLTDNSGPYIELMTGVYTDNQPDFTWLLPYEQKVFNQYFMPYKSIGPVKNANTDIMLSIVSPEKGRITFGVYATHPYMGCRVVLSGVDKTYYDERISIDPGRVLSVNLEADCALSDLVLSIFDAAGGLLLSYREQPETVEKIPEPAEAAKAPGELATAEELYLTGLHIEQYRHATSLPDPYYEEGLRRDPGDCRINNAYGLLLLRRGLYARAEACFRTAVARITALQPNPYDSEPYLNLGYALRWQNRKTEAYDAFYKATWSEAQAGAGFYNLAAIECSDGNFDSALAHVSRSLDYNAHNIRAQELKALVLFLKAGLHVAEDASFRNFVSALLERNPFEYFSAFLVEDACGAGSAGFNISERLGNRIDTYTTIAYDLFTYGQPALAFKLLEKSPVCAHVIIMYYTAFMAEQSGFAAGPYYKKASAGDVSCVFVNRLSDQMVLQRALSVNPDDSTASYLLGNLCYDKRRYEEARKYWTQSCAANVSFPTVHRNMALVLYNKYGEKKRAKAELEKAFSLDEHDARIFFELDQLYKKMGTDIKIRFENFENYHDLVITRDDLCVEYATLLNLLGSYETAYKFIMNRRFHPWEGGEGRVTTQYVKSLREIAKNAMGHDDYGKAADLLQKALVFPPDLGEGRLEGEKDNDIHYLLGLCYARLGKPEDAKAELEYAAVGTENPAGMMFYNDQPAEMILYQGLARRELGDESGAKSRFYKLIDYGEKHLFDKVKADYFAVSLPDLQLFEEDLNRKNRAHCYFLMGLGHLGLGETEKGKKELTETLKIDKTNLEAVLLLKLPTGFCRKLSVCSVIATDSSRMKSTTAR